MLAIVRCAYCGKEMGHAIGEEPIQGSISLYKFKHCKECYKGDKRERDNSFCSPDCLVSFVKDGWVERDIKDLNDELEFGEYQEWKPSK